MTSPKKGALIFTYGASGNKEDRLLRLFIFKLNFLCLQSEENILTYLNSLHVLGGGHGAGMAGLCARDSVLLSRLVQKWFALLDNLSKAVTEHCLTACT